MTWRAERCDADGRVIEVWDEQQSAWEARLRIRSDAQGCLQVYAARQYAQGENITAHVSGSETGADAVRQARCSECGADASSEARRARSANACTDAETSAIRVRDDVREIAAGELVCIAARMRGKRARGMREHACECTDPACSTRGSARERAGVRPRDASASDGTHSQPQATGDVGVPQQCETEMRAQPSERVHARANDTDDVAGAGVRARSPACPDCDEEMPAAESSSSEPQPAAKEHDARAPVSQPSEGGRAPGEHARADNDDNGTSAQRTAAQHGVGPATAKSATSRPESCAENEAMDVDETGGKRARDDSEHEADVRRRQRHKSGRG